MNDPLLKYYENELLFIRQMVQDFTRRYPAAAARLGLREANRADDPHVERLLESFAFLAAGVHQKIDDEFPELTDSLLGILYPHYLAPVPSMGIVEFEVNAVSAPLPEGFVIERGSKLHTQPVGASNLPCKFRTGVDVKLWPVEVVQARVQPPPYPQGLRPPPGTAAALRIQLDCQAGMKFAELGMDRLRFYLHGDAQMIAVLYRMIFNNSVGAVLRPGEGEDLPPILLKPRESLHQAGFELDEGLLPYPSQSFLGYRLLTEFFAFREKFLFVDVTGLERACRAGFQKQLEIVLFLNQSEPGVELGVDASTFRLGCTPIVNLFEHTAEPIQLTPARCEYAIVPDVAHSLGLEVYSVESVTSADPTSGTAREFLPFYSYHLGGSGDTENSFWYAARRPSVVEGDRGTDVYLNVTDLNFNRRVHAESVLTVRTLCTNRDLPGQLQSAGEQLALELESVAPLQGIRCLRGPTSPLRPPPKRGSYWRLISHLTLNHLSISGCGGTFRNVPHIDEQSRSRLQEILSLYDLSDPESGQQLAATSRQAIEGILGVRHRRVVGRGGSPISGGFCRGVEVDITLDEEKYVGVGTFLFASVLERFLPLYVSINSFTQLVARIKQAEVPLKKWPPRPGEQRLL